MFANVEPGMFANVEPGMFANVEPGMFDIVFAMSGIFFRIAESVCVINNFFIPHQINIRKMIARIMPTITPIVLIMERGVIAETLTSGNSTLFIPPAIYEPRSSEFSKSAI